MLRLITQVAAHLTGVLEDERNLAFPPRQMRPIVVPILLVVPRAAPRWTCSGQPEDPGGTDAGVLVGAPHKVGIGDHGGRERHAGASHAGDASALLLIVVVHVSPLIRSRSSG